MCCLEYSILRSVRMCSTPVQHHQKCLTRRVLHSVTVLRHSFLVLIPGDMIAKLTLKFIPLRCDFSFKRRLAWNGSEKIPKILLALFVLDSALVRRARTSRRQKREDQITSCCRGQLLESILEEKKKGDNTYGYYILDRWST